MEQKFLDIEPYLEVPRHRAFFGSKMPIMWCDGRRHLPRCHLSQNSGQGGIARASGSRTRSTFKRLGMKTTTEDGNPYTVDVDYRIDIEERRDPFDHNDRGSGLLIGMTRRPFVGGISQVRRR